jgi:hypothetical protein
MHKTDAKQGRTPGKPDRRLKKTDAIERDERVRLSIILLRGFAVALGYGDMSRDRFHVTLNEGVSESQLYALAERYLNGNPFPGTDPIIDGPKTLALMKLAEKAGLVTITHVKAGAFIPETGNR